MAVDTAAALRKLQSGRTLTAAEKAALGIGTSNLDAASAANAANAANTIKQLQDLGVGGSPTVDTRAALAKLTSGQTLTAAEKTALNLPVTSAAPTPTPTIDPLKNKAVKPDAPAGYHYTWIGGTTTGSWVMYKDAPGAAPTGGGNGTPTPTPTPTPTLTNPIPATQTGPTLAINTFKNTLALFFGQAEMSKPWVTELYNLANPYYKTGSSVDEALNMALQEGRNNANLKEFTTRFKGIFDLQDKLIAGQAVTVPTIAEFVATEAKMGDVLNQAGLASLNNQQFLGDIIGKGVNAAEFTNRINNVFLKIDQMPTQAKQFISQYLPTLDKTLLAKTLLTGDKGAVQLAKELGGMEVQAAAAAQGLKTDLGTASDISALGYGYTEAMSGFGQVAQALPTYEKLMEMRTGQDIATQEAQGMLQQSVFQKNVAQQQKLQQEAETEAMRFAQRTGAIGSKAFASQARGAGLI